VLFRSLRQSLTAVPGIRVYMNPMQDLHIGGRVGKSPYQFTLWDPDFGELVEWTPKVVEALKKLPELVDVSSDRMTAGLQADVVIDRMAASRLGVGIRDIDTALADAYAQRLI
jgi:multidrug efflux pump